MGFYCLLLLVTPKNPAQMAIVHGHGSVRMQRAVVAGELRTRLLMLMAGLLTLDTTR